MRALSIKNIIDFRGFSDFRKQSFASNIINSEPKTSKGEGGDYWVICLSAVGNSFRQNDLKPIIDKRNELIEKMNNADNEKSKTMYQRNFDILLGIEEIDLNQWKPTEKIQIVKKNRAHSVLRIRELLVKVDPKFVFSFKTNDVTEIGAIWFVARLGGYEEVELEMFTEILHMYLVKHFSEDFVVNPQYCTTVDVVNGYGVDYSQILKSNKSSLLKSTIRQIKKLM